MPWKNADFAIMFMVTQKYEIYTPRNRQKTTNLKELLQKVLLSGLYLRFVGLG